MAEPKVSILLQLVDKLSGPIQGVRGQLKAWGNDFKTLGSQATELLSNKLIQGVGFYGLVTQLGKAFEAADQFTVAVQKLDGTAKITGVSLQFLQDIANTAAEKFGLSKVQASDFAVEMAKLATKAGDVGKAGPALQSFLDIGAARGLTAEQTLKAVQQAILGIDEGTDKLFNANPSVLYKRFADSIGESVGQLTDQQKAQALLNAAMEDGSKVLGQYSVWLGTTAGQLQLAKNRTQEAYASIGQALASTRSALADAVAWLANGIQSFVGGLQLLGNDVGYFFAMVPTAFRNAWETLMVAVGSGIEKLGKVLPFVGDKIEEVGAKLKASHQKNLDEAQAYLKNLETAHEEAANEIVGIATASEGQQTSALATGLANRATATGTANTAAAAAAKQSHANLAALQEEAGKAQLALLNDQQREWEEVKRHFAEKMEGMTKADYAEAQRLLEEAHTRLLMKWADLDRNLGVVANHVNETALKPLTTDFPQAVDTKVIPATESAKAKFYDLMQSAAGVGSEISDAASSVLKFTQQIGMTNPDIEKMVGNIGQLGEGIKGIATALTGPDGVNFSGLLGGIGAAIVGLQGILGSIFGDSPAERARKELLRQNTVALQRLKDQVGDLMTSQTAGGKIARFQGSIAGIEGLASGSNDTPDRIARGAKLMQLLASQGLGASDLNSILGDLGISLGDWQKNGLTREQAAQLATALKNFEPGTFDQSFQGQMDFIDSLLATEGDNPQRRLSLILDALKGAGVGQLSSLVGGADLSSQQGRDALRAQLGSLLQQANSGGLNPASFGNLTGSEFIRVIQTIAGIVGQLGDGATTGTLPTGSDFSLPTGSGGLVMAGSDASVWTAIESNTKSAAEDLSAIRRAIENGDLGSVTIGTVTAGADLQAVSTQLNAAVEAINQALQAERDLTLAGTGG